MCDQVIVGTLADESTTDTSTVPSQDPVTTEVEGNRGEDNVVAKPEIVMVAAAMDDSCCVTEADCASDSIELYPVAEKLENRKDVGTGDSVCKADCVSIDTDVTDIEPCDGDTVTPTVSVLTVCDGDIRVSTTTVLASNVDDVIVGIVEYCADFVGVAVIVISIPVDIISVTKLSDIVDIGGVVTMVTDSVENSLIDCMSEMIVLGSRAVKMPEIDGVVST